MVADGYLGLEILSNWQQSSLIYFERHVTPIVGHQTNGSDYMNLYWALKDGENPGIWRSSISLSELQACSLLFFLQVVFFPFNVQALLSIVGRGNIWPQYTDIEKAYINTSEKGEKAKACGSPPLFLLSLNLESRWLTITEGKSFGAIAEFPPHKNPKTQDTGENKTLKENYVLERQWGCIKSLLSIPSSLGLICL